MDRHTCSLQEKSFAASLKGTSSEKSTRSLMAALVVSMPDSSSAARGFRPPTTHSPARVAPCYIVIPCFTCADTVCLLIFQQ